MAERFACIDFSKSPKPFRQVALEPGYPLLDRSNANARIIAKWLGRLAAEPERRGETVSWYVRSEQGARLDGVAVCPVAPKDLKGSLRNELQELQNRLNSVEPRTRAEKAVHRSIQENLNGLLEESGRPDLDSYFFKYQDEQGKWRLLWMWGFERTEPSLDKTAICVKNDCRALFINDVAAGGKCPYCNTALPIPPNPWKRLAVATVVLLVLAGAGFAGWWSMQPRAALSGVVLWEGNNQPVAGAEIRIPDWEVAATTDESGQFFLDRLPEGEAELEIAAAGYRPHSQTETLTLGEESQLKILLKGNATLTGRVKNGVSDVPLDEAEIQIAGTEFKTRSNGEGDFRIEDLPAGKHHVHVTRAGYPEENVEVEVSAENSSEITVPLIGKGIASGIVQKADKQPISGANVELLGTGQAAETDEDGVFVISNVPTGPGKLEVTAQGFADNRHELIVEEKEHSVHIYLLGAGLLSGTVTSKSDGEPITGATVAIEDTNLLTKTNDSGSFSLQGIPAGRVTVVVSAPGYRTEKFDRVVKVGRSTPLNVELEGGAVLAGVVKDGTTNKPLPNAEVITSVYPNPLRTDEAGRFKAEGVKAGPAKITADATGFQKKEVTETLKPGETTQVEITLLGDAKIRGTVLDGLTKDPIENAELKIAGTILTAKTGEDGQFEISGARSGQAKIEAIAKGYPPASSTKSLDSGKITDAKLELTGTAVLTGTVTDLAKKTPVSGAVATIADTEVSVKTDDKGQFKIEKLPAGSVTLEVTASGYKSTQKEQDVRSDQPNTVEVPLGGDAVLVGEVSDAITNKPIAKAMIGIAGNAVTTLSDAQGKFRLENAFGGKNEIAVSHADYPTKTMTVQLVSMKKNEQDIELTGSAVAKGLIVSPDDKPISGATVKLPGTSHETKTDETGAYELGELPGGELELEVSAEHYKNQKLMAKFTKDKTTDLPDARLVSGLNLTGQVVSAVTGKGLGGITVKIPGDDFTETTDATGGFRMESVPVAPFTVEVSGEGFYAETLKVAPVQGSREIKAVLSPVLKQGQTRIVLLWDDEIQDLDLHVYGPEMNGKKTHVWRKNQKAAGAQFDVENANGHGPETITLTAPGSGRYEIWVHAFDDPQQNGPLKINQSGAEVRVYQGGKQTAKRLQVDTGDAAAEPFWLPGAIVVENGTQDIRPYGSFNYKNELP